MNCLKLVSSAENFIDENFSIFAETEDFFNLQSRDLISIIKRDELKASEEKVYEGVLNWNKFAVQDRVSFLPEILSNVRLSLLPTAYLFDVVCKEPLIQSSEECKDLLLETMSYHLMSDTREMPKIIRNQPRNWYSGLIYILGGKNSDGSVSNIQVYDPSTNTWAYEENLEKNEYFWAASAVYGGKLYTFGGRFSFSIKFHWILLRNLCNTTESLLFFK